MHNHECHVDGPHQYKIFIFWIVISFHRLSMSSFIQIQLSKEGSLSSMLQEVTRASTWKWCDLPAGIFCGCTNRGLHFLVQGSRLLSLSVPGH